MSTEKTVFVRPVVAPAQHLNQILLDRIAQKLNEMFPIEDDKYVIELHDMSYEVETPTPDEVKEALLKRKSITVPVKGRLVVRNKLTGQVVSEKKGTIVKVPVFTPHLSLILDGNEYIVFNQVRIRPGVYVRIQRSGLPEAQFNLAKGENFSIEADPRTGEIYVQRKKGGKIPIVVVLRELGMSDEEISELLGKDLVKVNFEKAEKYKKDISDWIKSLEETKLDPITTQITLGRPHEKVTKETIVDAVRKLIKVSRGEEEEDDRTALVFREFRPMEELMAEALEKRSRPLLKKLLKKVNLNNGKIPEGFNLNSTLEQFVTTSSLTANPEQNNPLEVLELLTKITYMGEGGIQSEHAIPLETRDVHPTYVGFIDLIRTSESLKAGADLRMAYGTYFGSDGYPYQKFLDLKDGQVKLMSPVDLWDRKVGFSKDSDVVIHRGKIVKGKPDVVLLSPHRMFSVTTNLVPFLNSDHGNRAQMAAKMFTQAVPIVGREQPLVKVVNPETGEPLTKIYATFVNVYSPVDGTIVAVSDSQITIKDKNGKLHRVPLYNNYPLSRKTFLHQTPVVKKGDKVKAGDLIAEANYSKDGELALGTNLRVAYMPYHGLNHEDGIVISESAAKKLASEHMYKVDFDFDEDKHVIGKEKFKSYFPTEFTKEQLDKLDENGIVKPGTVLKPGDPIYVALTKHVPTAEDVILGRLSKSLVKTYKPEVEVWNKDVEGYVQDVYFDGKKLRVTIKTIEPAKEGDKITIVHGGKGVITKILPDDQMPRDEQGRPIEMIVTPLGILSRINPGQVYELLAAKVAEKIGKPIEIPAFGTENNYEFIKKLLKKYGVKDKERIFDPQDGKYKEVLVGPLYVLKLNKLTDFNFSARGPEGEYDLDLRPAKGGEEGSKAIGSMEFYGLVAHNVPNLLKEIATFKATKAEDFWNAVYLGKPLPAPRPTFATQKFFNMLKAAGINVEKKGDELRLLPMTDKEILRISNGEIQNPSKLRYDLTTEEGGLFDPVITGGLAGEKWAHITLAEPIVNPVFEDVVEKFLPNFRELPGEKVREELQKMKVDELYEKETDPEKKMILRALKNAGFKNLAEAYVLHYIPVIPPKFRPVVPTNDNFLIVSDPNFLYTDVILTNQALKELKGKLPDELLHEERQALYHAVKALFGLAEPQSPYAKARGIKGFLATVTGKGKPPKESYFQSKVVKKLQAPAGRATLITRPDLHLDEVGLPEDMAWKLYSPHVIQELVKRGYNVKEAKEMIEKKDPIARQVLEQKMSEIPVLINRAPTLWKYNIVALYPKIIEGKSVAINMLIAKGMAADLDGDTVNVHIPITPKAIEDAKKMLPSRIALSTRNREVLYAPSQEALIGLEIGSTPQGEPVKFKSYEEFLEALKNREIDWNTPVVIESKG